MKALASIEIVGGGPARGAIEAQGSKNAALHLIPASLLLPSAVIANIPAIPDIGHCVEIMRALGAEASFDSRRKVFETSAEGSSADVRIPKASGSSIRTTATFAVAALARATNVTFPLPGGDSFTVRPIDLHLKVAIAAGVVVEEAGTWMTFRRGSVIKPFRFSAETPWGPSLGGTVSGLILASLANGESEIQCASVEPEVVATANFLAAAGVSIEGVGTSLLRVAGKGELRRLEWSNPPDRIVLGTVAAIAVSTRGLVEIMGINETHLSEAVRQEFIEAVGASVYVGEKSLIVDGRDAAGTAEIQTGPYPGFPTDLQPQTTVALGVSVGRSKIEETVYQKRWTHLPQLQNAGMKLDLQDHVVTVEGPTRFQPSHFRPLDIRCGAAFLCASLLADGVSTLDLAHIERGYEDIPTLVSSLGFEVTRRISDG